jgi:excisionase family DNA binding protein
MSAIEYTTPAEPTGPLLHNIDQACALLGGMSRATLYRLAASGRIRMVKVGRRSYIVDDELRHYVHGLTR